MNYAVYNPTTNEVLTVVSKPSGKIPDGFQFVQESDLPAGCSRKNQQADVPDEVQTWQLREALAAAGFLTQVDTIIAVLPAVQKAIATSRWQFKPTIQRNHAITKAIGAGLNLTAKQMDDLFIQAAGIQ